ncbi:hypothetical protein KY290_029557 [Solanum tuberosum]|uniref:Uncharacterized protein n=1 Tax=Solanum tuberosum TaxID=4113 RepID=A0ABQ7UP93_SOLTU|nr:hypothetical protein KY289_028750 [Solanum tuberosum]KAH0750325.1 hypothetical protein KY290_029557 [Solanum tuberosum]
MESSLPSSFLNSQDSKGKDVDLTIYNEKVLLLPNGFEVLAFPCNQFLKQEPGTSEEAQQFACSRFKAEYPIFQKWSLWVTKAAHNLPYWMLKT